MKSRSRELLDKAIAATVSAIEIYNKPDFQYRGETFSILAVNGWELLLKAKWLKANNNKVQSLYVKEHRQKQDGSRSKNLKNKLTRSGNPFTHSLDHLAKGLVEQKQLDQTVWRNIQALLDIRDSAVHFHNRPNTLADRLQEVGAASLRNFVSVVKTWFERDLSKFNFYLMPLSFMDFSQRTSAIILNKEEKNFLSFLKSLEEETDKIESEYAVTVNIDVKVTRSKAKDAPDVRITSNPNAPEFRLTEEQIREQYPWSYDRLTTECRKRYSDFKSDQKYHRIKKALLGDRKFCHIRQLDPGNSRSQAKKFYNPNILQELDKHYSKK